MNPTEAVQAAIELLRSVDLSGARTLDDGSLCALVADAEALARRVGGIQIAAAAEVAERSRPELALDGLAARYGCVKPAHLIEQLALVTSAEAQRRVRLGSLAVGHLDLVGYVAPARYDAVGQAVAEGQIAPEAATVIVSALEDAHRVASEHDLSIAEAELVRTAITEPVDFVAALARGIKDRLDPDGIRPREEETRARRGIRLGRERNGVVPINGALKPENAALLRSVFDEANAPGAQPRFLSDEERESGMTTTIAEDGSEVTEFRDVRTREQRQEDVFGGILRAGVRSTGLEPGELRSTASVSLVISQQELESGKGIGWLDGMVEPVSAGIAQQLACDADYRKIVLGNDGEVLALGRTVYSFSTAQRKAIAIRDGGCVMCGAPASWCDVHHARPFRADGGGGRTDVDNGVLLCPRHHTLFHHSGWQLKMVGGVPYVLAPWQADADQQWRRVGLRRFAPTG